MFSISQEHLDSLPWSGFFSTKLTTKHISGDNSHFDFLSYKYILNGPVTAVFVGAGCLLNLFIVLVFQRRRLDKRPQSAISNYFCVLALWNTILLLSAFFMYCFPTFRFGWLQLTGGYVYLYRAAFTACNMAFVGSVWILIALIVDRYIALVRPLYHKIVWSYKASSNRICLLVRLPWIYFVFSFLFNWRLWFVLVSNIHGP